MNGFPKAAANSIKKTMKIMYPSGKTFMQLLEAFVNPVMTALASFGKISRNKKKFSYDRLKKIF
jgi:hypothetical protein